MRFEGSNGERKAREVLCGSELFHGLADAIERALSAGAIERYAPQTLIISEEADDDDIFVILSGEVEIGVRGRFNKRRGPGSNIGELSVIDPSQRRSATVCTCTEVDVLRLPEPLFAELADKHSVLWRRLAKQVAARLRQRLADVPARRERPIAFIGCSVEGLPYAEALQVRLEHDCISQIWTDGIFTPSSNTSTAVISAIQEADFCILIATADDEVVARAEKHNAPRDNVILELGIGLGALGQERSFFATPSDTLIRLPSDLSGVTPARINMAAETHAQAIGPMASAILPAIRRLGPK